MGRRAVIDIGIDLGTTSILIYTRHEGIILHEPSVLAVQSGSQKVIAVGEAAHSMLGKTHDGIKAIYPLRDGVIADYNLCETMVRYFLKKVGWRWLFRPCAGVCIPSGVTDVEARAVAEAVYSVGARHVYLVEEPMAAALGAGIDLSVPGGRLVVDIGGGTTDIAVLSLNGIVIKNSIRVAGNRMDEEIIRYVRRKDDILIGQPTAEQIKCTVGDVYHTAPLCSMKYKGSGRLSGLPQEGVITNLDVYHALNGPIEEILAAVHQVLAATPPELSADLLNNGILLTGGGAQLGGLAARMQESMHVPVICAENPEKCVAIGTGRLFDMAEEMFGGVVDAAVYHHRSKKI